MRHRPIRICMLVALCVGVSMNLLLPAYAQKPAARKKQVRGVVEDTQPGAATLQPGSYFALVIGNNNYKYLNKLQTAVNDAKDVAQMLRDTYGFSVKVLYDATRDDILTALVDYRKTL